MMIYILKSNRCSLTLFCMGISLVFGQNKFDSQLLTGGYRNDGNHHSWIYFTDKGLKTEADLEVALQLSMDNLNERTKQRRSKTRGPKLVDNRDIPVPQDYIDEIKYTGVIIRTVSKWLNAVSVSGTIEQLRSISDFPFVKKIDPVYGGKRKSSVQRSLLKSSTEPGRSDYGPSYDQLDQINVIAAHEAGYTGAGVRVLMLDTGYYTDHEAIHGEQVIAEWDFINNDGETQNEEGDPDSQHNHGTYTLSALGGRFDGELYGPAYEAEFLLAKTEDVSQELPIEEDQYVAGLEWGESLGADIASSSLGYMDWYEFEDLDGLTAVTTIAVNTAIENGMVITTAAGNYGSDGIIAPADAFDVITCGAVDEFDEITWFSSWGPTADGRIKPEVCARGLDTYCALPPEYGEGYGGVSGTSLSTPLIGGASALILQAHPDWTSQQVREALMMTASDPDNPDNQYGWGIIDVMAAIEYSFLEPETYWQMLDLPQSYQRHISTNGPNRVIAAGFDTDDMQFHIYFSDNSGDSWDDIPAPNDGFVTAEDILLTDDNNLYIPDFAYGVFHSPDFGQTWTGMGEFTPEGCASFNIHPSGVMFAGLTYSGIGFIHRSEDQGENWTAIPLPDYSSNYAVEHIYFNSQGHVYLGTINGVYRSTDVGLTWEKVNSGLGGLRVATMTIDADNDIYVQTTYPGLYDGYYRSQDGGDTWQALDFYDHIGWTVKFLSIGGSFYAIGSDYGVTFSDDDGETWAQINTGIDNDESYYQLYDLHLGGNGYLYLTGRYGYRTTEQVTEPCNEGFLEIGGDCYSGEDINVLQQFIDNSSETINMNMDENGNGVIEPLELGYIQQWNSDGRLVELDCGYPLFCGLSGEIPEDIGNMEFLESVRIYVNYLSGPIPESIGNLTNLSVLDLNNNLLSGTIPESICDIQPNLDVLSLDFNQLCPPYPECVEGNVGYQDTSQCVSTWHVSTSGSDSNNGSEESPFATIQHGIDVSSDGDSVLVSSGTYLENIDYNSKNIAVIGENRESTIIDGNQSGSVVTFDSIVGSTAVLADFTITGGNAYDGGGIYCTSSAPTIRDNIITGNVSETYGGGISCNYSSAVIMNNTITSNSAYYGGGISFDRYTSSVIKGNNISGNSAEEGGGIGCFTFSSPSITNNTISRNSAGTNGGGVYCYYVSSPTVTNTIIWDNTASTDPNISVYSADPLFNYCDVQGNWEGEGNIDADPLFVAPDSGDFHLQSNSPCIDAGDPESPLDPDGTISDMGAYYFHQSSCDSGFVEIEGICFNTNDIAVIQQFIDNSMDSGMENSPNPYMDSPDAWFWNVVDGQEYYFADGDGIVEPLELGLQEWENGRLKSIMCGAYIYCDLSGEIPENINYLTEIQQLRLEYNHLSGLIPETICELDVIMEDDLEFDITGNDLCPPYPECIEDYVGYQDTANCFPIVTIDYQLGWNLVGLPLFVEDASYIVLFPESIEGTLYSFNDGYISETYLDQGEGYWLRFDNAGSSTITGVPINELTISLNEGWNLISGISFPVDVNEIYDPNQLIIPGTVYGFGFGYTTADTIELGYGYWLRSVGEGEVLLSSGPSLVAQTISDCEFQYPDPSLNLEVNGNTMTLTMIHPELNCCLEPVWDGLLDGTVFHVTMTDVGDPCDCVCSFELSASFAPFLPGTYTLDFLPELFGNPVFIIPGRESGKGFSIPPRLASANSMTFNGQTLYFGLEIPEEEQLSYSLPPKPPAGAFDVRFSGNWKYCEDSGVIEVMNDGSPLIMFDCNIKDGEVWELVPVIANGTEWSAAIPLSDQGQLTLDSGVEQWILRKSASTVSTTFALHPAYPNPFNPITTLRYNLPEQAQVTLTIYDLMGREVTQLVNTTQDAGFKSVQWDATDSFGKQVSAGVYIYHVRAGEFVQTSKMVLLK